MTLSLDVKPGGLLEVFQDLFDKHKINLEWNQRFDAVGPVAMDVEHNESGGFVGVGFFDVARNTCCYFSDLSLLDRDWVLSLLFIAHNGVSDLDCLRSWGFPVRDEQLVWDTMLISHIIDSSLRAYGLKDTAKRDLDIEYPNYKELVGKGKNKVTLSEVSPNVVALYNGMDIYSTWKLYQSQLMTITKHSNSRLPEYFTIWKQGALE